MSLTLAAPASSGHAIRTMEGEGIRGRVSDRNDSPSIRRREVVIIDVVRQAEKGGGSVLACPSRDRLGTWMSTGACRHLCRSANADVLGVEIGGRHRECRICEELVGQRRGVTTPHRTAVDPIRSAYDSARAIQRLGSVRSSQTLCSASRRRAERSAPTSPHLDRQSSRKRPVS